MDLDDAPDSAAIRKQLRIKNACLGLIELQYSPKRLSIW
jgi:hypothetical protein